MCYSGCVYENYHGECRKPRNKVCPDGLDDKEIEEQEEAIAENLIQEEEDWKELHK